MVKYEYAGWLYLLTLDADGKAVRADLCGGEHHSGKKKKHCRNAVDQYNSEKAQ